MGLAAGPLGRELAIRGVLFAVYGAAVCLVLQVIPRSDNSPARHIVGLGSAFAAGAASLGVALALFSVWRQRGVHAAVQAVREGRVQGWELVAHPLGMEVRAKSAAGELPFRATDDAGFRVVLDENENLVARSVA
jgi:hypothetical protein